MQGTILLVLATTGEGEDMKLMEALADTMMTTRTITMMKRTMTVKRIVKKKNSYFLLLSLITSDVLLHVSSRNTVIV